MSLHSHIRTSAHPHIRTSAHPHIPTSQRGGHTNAAYDQATNAGCRVYRHQPYQQPLAALHLRRPPKGPSYCDCDGGRASHTEYNGGERTIPIAMGRASHTDRDGGASEHPVRGCVRRQSDPCVERLSLEQRLNVTQQKTPPAHTIAHTRSGPRTVHARTCAPNKEADAASNDGNEAQKERNTHAEIAYIEHPPACSFNSGPVLADPGTRMENRHVFL
jgi:hypothetical protein